MADFPSNKQPLTVRGFHGTNEAAAASILTDGFLPSSNDYDWLGRGVYFWQDAPLRARAWAAGKYSTTAAVVSATIDLDGCLDLLDIAWQLSLAEAYEGFVEGRKRLNLPLPRQTAGAHRLDHAVIEFLTAMFLESGHVVRSVRATFAEGVPIYPESAILQMSHVQISVRDSALISNVRLLR